MSFLLNFGTAYVVKILQLASGLWNYATGFGSIQTCRAPGMKH